MNKAYSTFDDELYLEISKEALVLPEFITTLPDQLHGYVHNVTNFIKQSLGSMKSVSELREMPLASPYDVEQLTKFSNYATLSKIDIYVPPGLSVTLGEFADTMFENKGPIVWLMPEVLTPAARWAAHLANNVEILTTTRNIKKDLDIKNIKIDDEIKAIGNCFKNPDITNMAPLGKAARSFSELEGAYDTAAKIHELLVGISTKAIEESVEEITKASSHLLDNIESSNFPKGIRKDVVVDIADIMYDTARHVEFYSAYSFRYIQLNTALTLTQKRMQEIQKG